MVPSTCTSLRDRLANCFVPNEAGGRFIVFEGVPGAGKTTAIRRIAPLSGAAIVPQLDHTLERTLLKVSEVQKWYLLAETERQDHLRRILTSSTDVLQDRNILSTLAFSYAWACRYSEFGHFAEVLRMVVRNAAGRLVRPDVLIVLTVDPVLGLMRRRMLGGEPVAEVWRDERFLRHHANFYDEFAGAFPAGVVASLDTSGMSLDGAIAAVSAVLDRSSCGSNDHVA